jgi:hypothetical protein
LHFDFGSFQCFPKKEKRQYVKSSFWNVDFTPGISFNNPTTKSLLWKASTMCFNTLGSASTAVMVARCAIEFARGYLTLNFVQAFAMNSGAPIYPILQPVMAKALATHLR